ncbi:MmcQ/YjbR family DNA-binding protein [Nocardioides sp. cx-169]|uniref:MmcQ/YjbR family DNA-binding protein n=1 Tax=Nocardioides sp. cx-169 TaxID=2899080 RepID=UPI001E47C763|nr:MmcQ/YjbR family DNA-binding protein [Nocardioides sp. cx-169]MCD4533171.1 MmcQ/YjbR family DNA-binding protein [Nocardioides sp. cx-169]
MDEDDELLAGVVRRLAAICLALPETREEDAWVGVRWRVRQRTFAHVCQVRDGRPEGYARAAGTRGPALVVVFRAEAAEAAALGHLGPPYFRPEWWPTAAGLLLDDDTDWQEVAELLTDSYRVQAPRRLAALVDGPGPPPT